MEPSRVDYCHPYKPYEIQLEFMTNLYQSIEEKKVAILESPTGTGKSLSLICGALTWLRDNARREIDGEFDTKAPNNPEDWLAAAEKSARRRNFLRDLVETEEKLAGIRARDAANLQALSHNRAFKKARVVTDNLQPSQRPDDEFMVDEYFSDDEKGAPADTGQALSSSTLALLNQLQPAAREEEEDEHERTKIIFCSRTHSQLTQFVNELRRVSPPSGIPISENYSNNKPTSETIKHLALGSRKNLCINERVSRLPSNLLINERCLELQKPGTAKDKKCQYLPGKDDKSKLEIFRNRTAAAIHDIEDLGKLGRKMELCPYYSSRTAISLSEVLTLPYPLLLQKTAREALGVQVKGNVVVIDEAHNLMGAIADTMSVSLSQTQLDLATKQIVAYVQRFKNKLKGSNRVYITQLIRLLNSVTGCVHNAAASSERGDFSVTTTDLMAGKGVDQIKPHKLLQYLITSKLAHKVEGYLDVHRDPNSSPQPKSVIMHFQSFLSVLINPDSEGRFFVTKQDKDVQVRYTLLDPREHFRDIVEQARSVILAGGTMSPMSDYSDYLFPYLEAGRLSTFSFGHVIPEENMFARSITNGVTGLEFDFTFEKRNTEAMIIELGCTVVSLCQSVPDGVVVFFPSYDYLAQVSSTWKRLPFGSSIISSLSSVKEVFEEMKDVSSEELLRKYSQAIDSGNGAIMLSVVGGKLSEGINFSDKLGRAVIAVGLPFPNMHSAEWKAKMDHVEHLKFTKCKDVEGLSESTARQRGRNAARDFYENACMRAVNQSIGRAIRHQHDYAAILLLDRRFATPRISSKLPQWIRSGMVSNDSSSSWASTARDLVDFFKHK